MGNMVGEELYAAWQDSVLPAPSVGLQWFLQNNNHSLMSALSQAGAAAGGKGAFQCCLATKWPTLLSSQCFSSSPLQTALPSLDSTSLTPTYHLQPKRPFLQHPHHSEPRSSP